MAAASPARGQRRCVLPLTSPCLTVCDQVYVESQPSPTETYAQCQMRWRRVVEFIECEGRQPPALQVFSSFQQSCKLLQPFNYDFNTSGLLKQCLNSTQASLAGLSLFTWWTPARLTAQRLQTLCSLWATAFSMTLSQGMKPTGLYHSHARDISKAQYTYATDFMLTINTDALRCTAEAHACGSFDLCPLFG